MKQEITSEAISQSFLDRSQGEVGMMIRWNQVVATGSLVELSSYIKKLGRREPPTVMVSAKNQLFAAGRALVANT
jgi:hypothetical protein